MKPLLIWLVFWGCTGMAWGLFFVWVAWSARSSLSVDDLMCRAWKNDRQPFSPSPNPSHPGRETLPQEEIPARVARVLDQQRQRGSSLRDNEMRLADAWRRALVLKDQQAILAINAYGAALQSDIFVRQLKINQAG